MARTYNVLTRFNAKDGVSKVTKSMTSGVNRFGKAMRDNSSQLSKGLKSANKNINRFATTGLAAVTLFAGIATKEFIQLDSSIVNAGAKFKDMDVNAAGFNDRLKDLTKSSREVGAVTEFSATDAAGALDKFAMAGISSQVSMNLLMGTTNLATNSGLDLTTAVDIATDSLGAFGIAAKMTGDKVKDAAIAEEGLARISDVFSKTTTTANTSLTELFESAKNAAPNFTSAGQSLETFAAFAGVLANSGLKGSEAGTQLKNMMVSLSKVTPEAQKALDNMSVKTKDANGNFRDAIDIIADLEKGLVGKGTAEKASTIATIFGRKTMTGMNLLLQEGASKLRDYRGELENAKGASLEMANAIRGSLGNQIKVLQSSLIEFGLKVVSAFSKDGEGGLQSLIETVQNMNPEPLIQFGKVLIRVIGFLVDNWKILATIAVTIKTVSIAMGVLNAATALFGLTLAATPIGWLIGAVALLSVGVAALALNWDSVTKAMRRVPFLGRLFDSDKDLSEFKRDEKFKSAGGKLLNEDERSNRNMKLANDKLASNFSAFNQIKTSRPTLGPNIINEVKNNESEKNRGAIDVNFNNLPENTDVKQTSGDDIFNLNFKPTYAY